ncbi:MAG TPA: hypothetical protein VFF78_08125 [Anaerolineaceae bacterium]|nr:hypothetical protein [Anaerolineaceae bacterium]
MNLPDPKNGSDLQPGTSPAWILSPVAPLRVELVDALPGAPAAPGQEPPDLLVESFCEV